MNTKAPNTRQQQQQKRRANRKINWYTKEPSIHPSSQSASVRNDCNAVNHASALVDRKRRTMFCTLIVFCVLCGCCFQYFVRFFSVVFYPRQRKLLHLYVTFSNSVFVSFKCDLKLLFKNLLFILSYFYVSYCIFSSPLHLLLSASMLKREKER